MLSYAHGVGDAPLLGETIGAALAPHRRALRRPRRARRPLAGLPRHAGAQLREDSARDRARPPRPRRGPPAIASASGRPTATSGWSRSSPARASAPSSSTSTPPTRPPSSSTCSRSRRRACSCTRAPSARATTAPCSPRCARACPTLREAIVFDDDWAALADAGRAVPPGALAAREASLQFDDPINIQYTSGTTGFPKGATLTHHNILNNGYFVGERAAPTAERDRVCIPVPFYHCFGMVMGNLACVAHGAAMVIPGEAFDAGRVLETVAAERCTALYGVPTMFIAELDHPRFADVRSRRRCAPASWPARPAPSRS